jgi:hypothetical protein
VDIYDGSTLLDTVVVNQQENDGQWNPLGVFLFSSGTARVVVRSESNTCSTCADAARFLPTGCELDARFAETTLNEGMEYYTDRSYTLTSVPSQYTGMDMIKPPNDDRQLTYASGYLTFEMPYDGQVYVAYDSRASKLPNWMNGFSNTGDRIYTSLSTQPYLRVYSRSYSAGECVDLGANYGPGSSGENRSNYIVFFR